MVAPLDVNPGELSAAGDKLSAGGDRLVAALSALTSGIAGVNAGHEARVCISARSASTPAEGFSVRGLRRSTPVGGWRMESRCPRTTMR